MKQRDLILAEMDGLTGRLVADHHDAVSNLHTSKAKEALRQECPAAKPIAGPRAVTMVATTGPHKGIAFKMTVGAAACFVGRSGGARRACGAQGQRSLDLCGHRAAARPKSFHAIEGHQPAQQDGPRHRREMTY